MGSFSSKTSEMARLTVAQSSTIRSFLSFRSIIICNVGFLVPIVIIRTTSKPSPSIIGSTRSCTGCLLSIFVSFNKKAGLLTPLPKILYERISIYISQKILKSSIFLSYSYSSGYKLRCIHRIMPQVINAANKTSERKCIP